jgi:F-type H+-transporting ATPase subunit epsilon
MALPAHLTLAIVTPDRAIVHDQVDEVEIPGADGYFGVLPGHTPLLASLQVGELWYRKAGGITYLSVAFGFAEVLPDRVTILAQVAERAEEIDVARAEEEKRSAETRLARRASDQELEAARISMLKALARLRVATRARTRM